MTTNILALITTLFLTNTTDHWPQKAGEQVRNPGYDAWAAGKHTHPFTLEYCPEFTTPMVDDTAADAKVVETTVTRQRLLSAEAEGVRFTNVLTSEVTEHYEADWRLVRTNNTRTVVLDSETFIRDGIAYRAAKRTLAEVQEPTNWWQEAGYWTNELVGGHGEKGTWTEDYADRFVGSRRSLPLKPEASVGHFTNRVFGAWNNITNVVLSNNIFYGTNIVIEGVWDILSTNELPTLESLSNRYDIFRIEALGDAITNHDARFSGRRKRSLATDPIGGKK